MLFVWQHTFVRPNACDGDTVACSRRCRARVIGRVAQAFRKLLVFDKRVGFACSRVRMLASVLKTRLRSAALRSTPQYKSGEPMNNRRMLLDQRAPTAIDGHLISLEAGSLDIAAAQGPFAPYRPGLLALLSCLFASTMLTCFVIIVWSSHFRRMPITSSGAGFSSALNAGYATATRGDKPRCRRGLVSD